MNCALLTVAIVAAEEAAFTRAVDDAVASIRQAYAEGRAQDVVVLADRALLRAEANALGEVRFWRGAALRRLGRHEEALIALDSCAVAGFASVEVHLERALALSALGRRQEAEQEMETVRRMIQEDDPTRLGRLESMKLYAIPRGKYRDEIATPSARFRGETVTADRDRWADVEETLQLGSSKVVVAHYPGNGESDAPTTFGHGERTELNWSDATLDQRGMFTMGLPIMLRFFGGEKLTDVDVELKPKGGRALACRKYLNGDKRVDMENLPTVLLLPEKPLDKGTSYEVRIKGKLDGTPFERKWEFGTAK
jgi:tetratricopeptide (TPR) repeat protein